MYDIWTALLTTCLRLSFLLFYHNLARKLQNFFVDSMWLAVYRFLLLLILAFMKFKSSGTIFLLFLHSMWRRLCWIPLLVLYCMWLEPCRIPLLILYCMWLTSCGILFLMFLHCTWLAYCRIIFLLFLWCGTLIYAAFKFAYGWHIIKLCCCCV